LWTPAASYFWKLPGAPVSNGACQQFPDRVVLALRKPASPKMADRTWETLGLVTDLVSFTKIKYI